MEPIGNFVHHMQVFGAPFFNTNPGVIRINHMKTLIGTNRHAGLGIPAFRVFLGLSLLLVTASAVRAQGQAASGTITASGTGPFDYSLSFSDAGNATSPIGSIWYSWVPGEFFLPSSPTSASAPPGWTATISGNSVQFVASSSASDITPGETLSGFGYAASFSPSELAAAPNSGESVAYSAGLFSDAGNTFTVQTEPVPEPSPLALILLGTAGWSFLEHRKVLLHRARHSLASR